MHRSTVIALALAGFVSVAPAALIRADEKPVSELLEALKSDNVANRRNAAQAISRLDAEGKKEALPGLIDRIASDKDPQTRLAVLDAFFELGPDAAPAVPVLVGALKKNFGGAFAEEQYARFRVAWTLGAIGPEAVEPLRPVMSDRIPRTRIAAALAIGRIGPPAAAAVPELITLLGDSDADVRKEAVRTLGRIGVAAEEPLLAAIEGANPQVLAGIISSLGAAVGTTVKAQDAVTLAAGNESPLVRSAAVRAAAALKFAPATLTPMLIDGLSHENADLRLAVINVVVSDRSLLSQIAPRLTGLLISENEGVSRHAAYLLQTIGLAAAPDLIAALRDERTRVDQLADALGGIGSRVTELLVKALQDENPRVRRGAALALGRARPVGPGSVETLTAALSDPAAEVQVAALDSIGQLGPHARKSMEQLKAMLKKESPEARSQAIEAMFRVFPHDDSLLAEYVVLLDDADPRVQQRAIDSIRRLGALARKALTPIVEKLRSPVSEVRLAAGALVGSLGRSAAEAVPALTPLLADADPSLRAIAAEALGSMGAAAQPALPDLVRLLDDGEVSVRAAATQALGGLDLDPEQARPHVAKSLRDAEADVRSAALAAIQKFRRRSSIFLPDLVRLSGNERDVRAVRETLRGYERRGPDPASIPELLAFLDSEPDPVRLRALDFIGLAGSAAKESIPRLEALAEDPNEEIQKRAKTAIEKIKSGRRGNGMEN